MVEGGGFEPPKLARQIYSLIPLATREPLLKTYPQREKSGAGERSRTPDRLITSQLLYQLSYASTLFLPKNGSAILENVGFIINRKSGIFDAFSYIHPY